MPVGIGRTQRNAGRVATAGDEIGAARAEKTPHRAFLRQRDIARDGHQRAAALVAADIGNAVDQPLGIGVLRPAEHFVGRGLFDHGARIHDADAIAAGGDQPQIVRDVQKAGGIAAAQFGDQIEHCRLDGDVEAGGGFVEQQQRRAGQQRHGDHHALLLATRQLMRIAPQDVTRRQASVHQRSSPLPSPWPPRVRRPNGGAALRPAARRWS